MDKKNRLPVIWLGIIVFVFLFIWRSGVTFENLSAEVSDNPVLAAFVILLVYSIKPFLIFVPLNALYISAGFMFAPLEAFIITAFGLFLTMTIGYFMGRRLGADRVAAKISENEKVSVFLESHQSAGVYACVVSRLSPLPFDLMSMFFGSAGLGFSQYVFSSYMGALPFMAAYLYMGESAGSSDFIGFILPFLAVVFTSVFAFFAIRKKSAEEAEE